MEGQNPSTSVKAFILYDDSKPKDHNDSGNLQISVSAETTTLDVKN